MRAPWLRGRGSSIAVGEEEEEQRRWFGEREGVAAWGEGRRRRREGDMAGGRSRYSERKKRGRIRSGGRNEARGGGRNEGAHATALR